MQIVIYAVGVLFGSTIIVIMYHVWGLTWKQIGIYTLLSWLSGTFFRVAHDMKREQKAERKRQAESLMKQRT